ncbi:MAG: YqgE/AlgH family protein [Planctomyces sp.]|nr:YqgE/AlgH family protein [Planctomyces sp.]
MSESLKGQLLIAGYRLRDANFFKTAVLLVEHSDTSAMGLVINRPSSITVANALAGHFEFPEGNELVYVGGPVEPAALFILHDSIKHGSEEEHVAPGLYVASCAESFEGVIEAAVNDDPLRCRVYSGCAGWGPGQLEEELGRGDWMLLDDPEDFVFHDDPYCVWEELVNAVYARHRLLPHPSVSPEWN